MAYTKKPQNINTIANVLKNLGGNESSIIAVLCNMGGESGWDPYATEVGRENAGFYPPSFGWQYRRGEGLVQLSYTPANKQIFEHKQTHTELECIQFQCNMLFTPPVQSWLNFSSSSGRNYNSILDFWTNQFNLSARDLSGDWFAHYERGDPRVYGFGKGQYFEAGQYRYDLFINTVNANIQWGSSTGGGGSVINPPVQEEKPEETKKRLLTLQECLSLFDKAKPKPSEPNPVTPETPPNPPLPKPTNEVERLILECYNLFVEHNTHYSTTNYAIRCSLSTNPWIADCSSFVMATVHYIENGNLNNFNIQATPNTVGMHSVLKLKGYTLVRKGKLLEGDFKSGDIVIMGSGGGTAGHTITLLNDNETVEVQGGDGWYTYAMAKRTIDWHRTYNFPYFDINYLYRRGD